MRVCVIHARDMHAGKVHAHEAPAHETPAHHCFGGSLAQTVSICRDLSCKICGVVPIGRRSRTRAKTSLFFHPSAFFHFTRWETFFASQAISMNVIAGIWTLPIGVAIYTMAGGIKATILTDYAHNIIV